MLEENGVNFLKLKTPAGFLDAMNSPSELAQKWISAVVPELLLQDNPHPVLIYSKSNLAYSATAFEGFDLLKYVALKPYVEVWDFKSDPWLDQLVAADFANGYELKQIYKSPVPDLDGFIPTSAVFAYCLERRIGNLIMKKMHLHKRWDLKK